MPLHLDPPNQLTPQIFYGDLNSFIGAKGFNFPSSTSGLDPGRALGRTMSYSFGIQRMLGQEPSWTWLMSALSAATCWKERI